MLDRDGNLESPYERFQYGNLENSLKDPSFSLIKMIIKICIAL